MTLTQRDLSEIEILVDEKLEEKTKNLPTKDEFFGWMDKIMTEMTKIRENFETITHRVYEDHELRRWKTNLQPIRPHRANLG